MPEAPVPFIPLEGGCGCQKLRYRMEASPLVVHCCYCTYCQRETGSAFTLSYVIEAEKMVITAGEGEILRVETPTESGSPQTIARCPKCYISIYSNYGGTKDVYRFARIGTLDTCPQWLKPDIHIYTRSKPDWVVIPEGVRAEEAFYEFDSLWSKEALKRWAVIVGKIRGVAIEKQSEADETEEAEKELDKLKVENGKKS